MPKHVLMTVSLITALLIALASSQPRVIQAFDPSFPTRTPTPGPGGATAEPTATSGDPGSPGNPGNPSPTGTSPSAPGSGSPQPSPSSAPGVPGTGSGLGTPIPTVVLGGTIRVNPGGSGECSDTPYIRALGRLIIYGGPGVDYGPVSTLEVGEMRPITGRAAYAEWWQILVKPNMIGWVQDREVEEFGNTALVPIAEPPAINGATPTPGIPWNPTPLPLLSCVPTPTPTATPTATEMSVAPGGGEETGASAPESEAQQPDMVSAEIVATPVSQGQPAAGGETGDSAAGPGMVSRGSSASRATSPTSVTNLLLPLVGLALIAVGIVLALASRKRGTPKAE
ncbi:MAG TPA: hypothetical protein PLR07_00940 [Promineifilum sp.]|nr:hypothetical protein [Promineifilum sp.]